MKTECTAHNQFLLGTVASHSGQAAIKDLRGAFATGLWAGTEFLTSYHPYLETLFGLAHEFAEAKTERGRHSIGNFNSYAYFAQFNRADIGAVYTCALREFFLGETELLPSQADGAAKTDPRKSCCLWHSTLLVS